MVRLLTSMMPVLSQSVPGRCSCPSGSPRSVAELRMMTYATRLAANSMVNEARNNRSPNIPTSAAIGRPAVFPERCPSCD